MNDVKDLLALARRPLVLVVDDNATSRFLACKGVELGGMHAEDVPDGESALEAIRIGKHDIVILDVLMPGLSGFEVCKQLRADPESAATPILIMTTLSDTGSVEQAYECGATDFITKPINPLVLAHRLRYMLRAAGVERDLRQRNAELIVINAQLQEARTQLFQADKMASIGQLAAGVAHEINNPIGYVRSNFATLNSYLQRLFELLQIYEQSERLITDDVGISRITAAKERLDIPYLSDDAFALLRESSEGVLRVSKIVQDLKDFSHVGSDDEWCWANLHRGLDSTINIVNHEIKYKANVIRNYGALPEIECLPSQLNQVFMNLLVNAAQAIRGQGTITIQSGMHTRDEVFLEISDTGSGIPPEHVNRVFDPFFTTKPVGKGTGLGLALSYGIVKKHGGRIDVASELGKGTTFSITLPVRQNSADTALLES